MLQLKLIFVLFDFYLNGLRLIRSQMGSIEEIINIQPQGSKAKGYQVKQIRNLIVKYRLGDSNVD